MLTAVDPDVDIVDMPFDDVDVGIHGGQHRDLGLDSPLPQFIQEFVAGHPGHPAVQERDVDLLIDEIESLRTARRGADLVLLGELHRVELGQLRLVVDDQHRPLVDPGHGFGRDPRRVP